MLFRSIQIFRVISLSKDGETLAIGYIGGIDIYNLQDGMWKQIGNSILAAGKLDLSISLSSNGSRVATGGGPEGIILVSIRS